MSNVDDGMAASGGLVLDLGEVDRSRIGEVGGKGAQLGELTRIDGVEVPAGFCVTTAAFRGVTACVPSLRDRIQRASTLDPDDTDGIRLLSKEIRDAVAGASVPDDLAAAITASVGRTGADAAYAVRSSATAEDLPTASFAGQQDTYLNVVGAAAVLDHVRACWASLFTERALAYRRRHGIDTADMAVVVQQMVVPDASGVLFTADPVTSNRTRTCIEAVLGLGEALVSGVADADRYTVRDGVVVDRVVAVKQRALRAAPGGGTTDRAVDPDRAHRPALTDDQAVRLAALGRRIEAHAGCPQDIEWCLVDDGFQIVQTRPITTLFPVPDTDDGSGRVYVSVGHQQMMTDAMTPLGLSMWQMTTARPMAEAGGRLFVDVTAILAAPAARERFLASGRQSDPLLGDALQTVLDRGDVVPAPPGEQTGSAQPLPAVDPLDADPALVEELIADSTASLTALARDIRDHHGPDLFDVIVADVAELRRLLTDRRSYRVFMTAMDAATWLTEHMQTWLGEQNAADTLTLSAPHNVTSEMGLALLDVADVIRPHPHVVAHLRGVGADGSDTDVLAGLDALPGGREAGDALRDYLDRYGMRCVGEIDISRPRWSEHPAALIPAILAAVDNTDNAEPGAARRRFDHGRRLAEATARDLLDRLAALPDGRRKADQTKVMIDRLRTFIGYREFPKYAMVSRYFLYKQALLGEAERLVHDGVLARTDDIHYLRFDELHDVVRTRHADHELIRARRDAFARYRTLTPPRVLTSDGEALTGTYRRDDLPADALVGLAVSGGTVTGRARVVLDMADADLQPGDILVTAFTDPSWSPMFVTIAALVTDVGGLMTHGAVVAREYGLPAVVGVDGATRRIPDRARIRVDGTNGTVEILPGTDA